MTWWQILLTVYFGLNVIIAIFAMIIFEKLGYYGGLRNRVLMFLMVLVIGTPLAILGLIEFLSDALWR